MTRDPDPIVMYIVVRKSLKLVAGKVGAQCGHAVQYLMQRVLPERHPSFEEIDLRAKHGVGALTSEERVRFTALEEESRERYERHEVTRTWLEGDHAKIVLGATDEEFLLVQVENEHHFLVTDLGYTQVAPNTETAIGLWPCRKSESSSTVQTLKPLR